MGGTRVGEINDISGHIVEDQGLYVRCDSWQIDLDKHIRSRINQPMATGCRTFRPRRHL